VTGKSYLPLDSGRARTTGRRPRCGHSKPSAITDHRGEAITSCECEKVYLVVTETDGAHFKAERSAEQVEQLYEALPGDEQLIRDAGGTFACRSLRRQI
jgi:hypothetical protein